MLTIAKKKKPPILRKVVSFDYLSLFNPEAWPLA